MNIYNKKKKSCKCCMGAGVQTNKQTGLRQPCPYCGGTGIEKEHKSKITWR